MSCSLQLISAFVSLLATVITVSAIIASETPSIFSSIISRTYGPKNEPCTTKGMVLSSVDNWLDRLKNAKPGNVFLLRAGTYDVTTTLALPNGDANNPIIIQPYNCEAATLLGKSNTHGVGTTLLPGSYNTIAGLRIESATHEKLIELAGNARDVEFRNNTLYGGRNDAIRIIGGVANILFSGNDINSGPAQPGGITGSSGGHVFVIGNGETAVPNVVRIVRNKIRGSYFGNVTAGDDTIAVSGGNNVVIEENYLTENYNIEEVIDIKSRYSKEPVTVRGNVFQNNFLGTYGGQDGGLAAAKGAPEITIGDHDAPPALLQHVIESNYFERGISVGPSKRNGSALIRNNILSGKPTTAPTIIFNRAFNTLVINNTFYRGGFKIGRSGGCIPATGLTFKYNIFYETFVNDQTDRCSTSPYTLVHNVLYKLDSGFERGVQASNITTDPFFINPAAGDFRLKSGSPALAASGEGTPMGALVEYSSVPLSPISLRVTAEQP